MEKKIRLSYLAGAIDSDGYITFTVSNYRKNKGQAKNPDMYELIGLTQITKIVPQLLKKEFSGCLFTEKSSTKNGKMLYTWRVSRVLARKCIKELYPYLKIKKKQAKYLIRFESTVQRNNKPLSLAKLKQRQKLLTSLRSLNDIKGRFRNNYAYLLG